MEMLETVGSKRWAGEPSDGSTGIAAHCLTPTPDQQRFAGGPSPCWRPRSQPPVEHLETNGAKSTWPW